jgi:hypothetical protein
MTRQDWPEPPDPLGHLIAIVEDIRNLIQASSAPVLGSGVADETPGGGEHSPLPPPERKGPGPVVPPAGPHFMEVEDLARAIYTSGKDAGLHNRQDVFEKSPTRHAHRRTAQALIDVGYRK